MTPPEPPQRRGAARRGGFTMFEVLGAVALLAIVYSVLATTAVRGLRSEGESGRLLEASMIVDWQLAEIEMQLDRGEIPDLGLTESETEDGAYVIAVDVEVLDLPELTTQPSSLLSAASSESITTEAREEPVFGENSPLREITVEVSWEEPEQTRSVTRTTYAFDIAAFAPPPPVVGPGALPGAGTGANPVSGLALPGGIEPPTP